jgi:hypothetical protein
LNIYAEQQSLAAPLGDLLIRVHYCRWHPGEIRV